MAASALRRRNTRPAMDELPDVPSPAAERRTRHELRALFPAACAALQPFFDPATLWAGQSHEHLALRTLKEQFPQLTAQDSFLVVITAKRLFASGQQGETIDP
jgi:hypothetical protein